MDHLLAPGPDDTVSSSALLGSTVRVQFSNGAVFRGTFVDDGIPNNGIVAVLQVEPVPEPASAAVFAVFGLTGLVAARRRRQTASAA